MKALHIYIFIFCVFFTNSIFPQGLKFKGNEVPIDNRTSLVIFHEENIAFVDNYEINFDLTIGNETHLGHIIRVKNKKSDRIYNFIYEGRENNIFWLNDEGRSTLIKAEIDRKKLDEAGWIHIKIKFDILNKSIQLHILDEEYIVDGLDMPNQYIPEIIFGRSDYIIDVPSFAIKNLSIGNESKTYKYPLTENNGNIVHEKKGSKHGTVINPEWLINDAYKWNLKTTMDSKYIAGSIYNDTKKEVYYFNKDSITIYNIRKNTSTKINFKKTCPVQLSLANCFLDPDLNKLYVYETYFNNDNQGATVASLDLDSYTWTVESDYKLQKELHHHGYFYDNQESQLIIFGGYGRNKYNKNFYCYDLPKNTAKELNNLDGDIIYPRYFLSTTYDNSNKIGYLFGGMGNETGEHIVGRKYFYDLYKIDFKNKKTTKLWETAWSGENIVPARNLVIVDSALYALCYPEHFTESFLQLYEFSLEDGSHQTLGDSIPIYSDKITTNAKLYYDKQLSSLIVLSQESTDDISSSLKVYTLAFPAISYNQLITYQQESNTDLLFYIYIFVGGILIFALLFVLGKKIQVRKNKQKKGYLANKSKLPLQANAIYMFGIFTVLDRDKKDITHLFSSRLKRTLCVILESSLVDGISSQQLSEILWPDKAEDKVKNLRGVTINHLRKALSELDGVELIFDKGMFKILSSNIFYCDFLRCMQILNQKVISDEEVTELLQMIDRGKFLKNANEDQFDFIKHSLENKVEPILLSEIENSYSNKLYQQTIDIADALFTFDSLSEDALSFKIKSLVYLKKENEAILLFQHFITEYKTTMGTNYTYTFNELI